MLKRAEELKQQVRETPLNNRLDDARRRIGKMCSEGRPPRMTIPVQYDDDDFYISTTLSDAQATIADLQGQLKAAKAPRMYDCGSCAIGKGFEQRVAQLEGEKQEYMQAATNEQRLALPMPKRTVLEPFGEKASRFTIHYDGGHPGCKVVIESADGALDAIAELLTDEYRKQSSLPAHRAKLAQGGAGKHACDLPGCVSCGNPPDTEGETRA